MPSLTGHDSRQHGKINYYHLKEDNAREQILTAEEARRLLENAAESIRPALIIALNTSMRKN